MISVLPSLENKGIGQGTPSPGLFPKNGMLPSFGRKMLPHLRNKQIWWGMLSLGMGEPHFLGREAPLHPKTEGPERRLSPCEASLETGALPSFRREPLLLCTINVFV